MEIESFAEIEQEFVERAHRIVWCNVATIDRQNRVRSRILHPFWENGIGWVITRRNTLKAKHLEQHPYVSLAYAADPVKPTYVDCLAEWDESLAQKQHIWNSFKTAAPPLGYDPAIIFPAVDAPDFGLLKFTPWRLELGDMLSTRKVWRRK